MKKILVWITVAVVVLVGGFYALNAYIYNEKQADNGEMCAQVLTDARNPDTGEIQTFPTPCDVPEGWDTLETDHETFQKGGETWTRYRNDDLGIRFEYRTSPNGLLLVEQNEKAIPYEHIIEYVTLFDESEYLELMVSSVAREGPPGISFMVIDNPEGYTPEEWVEEVTILSNVGLSSTEPERIEFSGVPAVRYTFEGLYTNDTIIALNNGKIYYISGSYAVEDSPIREDFLEILDTVSLY